MISKKWISVLLTLCMLITVFPVAAFADGTEYEYTIEYYYENEFVESNTVHRTAELGSTIKDFVPKPEFNGKTYPLFYITPDDGLVITNNEETNVLYVDYLLPEISYTVNYYRYDASEPFRSDIRHAFRTQADMFPTVDLEINKYKSEIDDPANEKFYVGQTDISDDRAEYIDNETATLLFDGAQIYIDYIPAFGTFNVTHHYVSDNYKDGVYIDTTEETVTETVPYLDGDEFTVGELLKEVDGYKYDENNPFEIKIKEIECNSIELLAVNAPNDPLDDIYNADSIESIAINYYREYHTTTPPSNNNNNNHDDDHEEEEYTLTFDANGGDKLKPVTRTSGSTVNLTRDRYIPTREGYTFDGWYSNAKLTKEVKEVTLYSDKTVYAKWVKNVEAPVKQNPAMGAGDLQFAGEALALTVLSILGLGAATFKKQ